MIESWVIIALALAYLGGLFAIAWYGDRKQQLNSPAARPYIYALSIGAYCTSWTFFGSVGSAATTGYNFLPTYVGPVLLFVFFWRLIQRIVRVAKAQNITSIADFLASRYGKNQTVAALATIVAVVGVLPYMALQLKAVALSFETLLGSTATWRLNLPVDTAFVVAVVMAAFAILFGTRKINATEHQDGLMLAIATESVVKLAAFLSVGIYVSLSVFGSPAAFWNSLTENPELAKIFANGLNPPVWITVTLLSFIAVLLLPRQFHVIVVENKSETEVRSARWLFPLYLVAINIFVIPIAAAGLLALPKGAYSPDTFVLALPLSAGETTITMIGFIGGLSAATAMVIIDSVAVAVMICNGLVVPLLTRRRFATSAPSDYNSLPLLMIRRIAIFAMLMGSYCVFHLIGQERGLVSVGLVSFAAIAQLAPAFFGGLFWTRATARGAIAGISAGILVWTYTLVLPWFADAGILPLSFVTDGPFGLALLKPNALLGLHLDPLSHSVVWSLLANCVAYAIGSLSRQPFAVERAQAAMFVYDYSRANPARIEATAAPQRTWQTSVTVGELQATVARYHGVEATQNAFNDYYTRLSARYNPAYLTDAKVLGFAEHLLASAVGAASSRLILSLLLRKGQASDVAALRLLDSTSESMRFNRDQLQSAIDEVRHGLGVFDRDLKLIFWNRQFRDMLLLPHELANVGVTLDQILRAAAQRGDFGQGPVEELVERRMTRLAVQKEAYEEFLSGGRRRLEIRPNTLPQGGIVITLLDITERYAAADALTRSNETLEHRVRERTAEILSANNALAIARARADKANLDKTSFLNAASHDVMQPLNAARLYMSTLLERKVPPDEAQIVKNIDASLSAVEEILSTLIDIARLDAGRMEPNIAPVSLSDLFDQLTIEFTPHAKAKSLTLQTTKTDLVVESDARLLKRILQNLISNAIKYTSRGTVMLTARSDGRTVTVTVADTGNGIPSENLAIIFKEFERLKETAESVRGLGLGLSIVERITRMLGHPITVRSTVGRGSTFSIEMPATQSVALPTSSLTAPPVETGLTGLTVLCVDNEPAILDGLRLLLSEWGCKALLAATIEGAVAHVASTTTKIDLILTDFHLDQGTGFDVITRVRALTGTRIPAIIVTAEGSADLQREIREQADAFLRKPVKAAQLRSALTHLTRQRIAAE
jgi:Na+/proline symporter/signal transduction histidine kinase/CheY-like chemotaxis protein